MTKKAVKELAPIVKKKVVDYARKHGKDIAKKGVKILAEKANKKDEKLGDLVQKAVDDPKWAETQNTREDGLLVFAVRQARAQRCK